MMEIMLDNAITILLPTVFRVSFFHSLSKPLVGLSSITIKLSRYMRGNQVRTSRARLKFFNPSAFKLSFILGRSRKLEERVSY